MNGGAKKVEIMRHTTDLPESPARTTRSQQYVSLQVLRGLAAVAVVFYHTYIILMEPQYGGAVVFQPVARYGFLGVCFFFVLSGFIIFLAHARDVGLPDRVPAYLYKRFVRVYPAYWIYLTAFIAAAYAGFGHPDFSSDPLNLLSAYSLVQLKADFSLPLQVAWTLVYEIRFYLLFALLILIGRKGFAVFAVWTAAIFAHHFGMLRIESDLFALWNLYFICGGLGCWLLSRLPEKFGPVTFLLGVCLFGVYVAMSGHIYRIAHLSAPENEWLHFILAPAFLLIILGAAQSERLVKFPLFMRLLGDGSYSIYLVHSAVISAMVIVGQKVGLAAAIGPPAFFLLMFATAIAAGLCAYFIVERPLLNLVKRRGLKPRQASE